MTERAQRTYLGDGLYADYQSLDCIRVWCDRGNGVHEVFVEPDMLQRLIEFAQTRGWKLRP